MSYSCPVCKSKVVKKNGYTRHGKQNYRCLNCGRQFSVDMPPPNDDHSSQNEHDNIEYHIIFE